jgi:4,4'-diaponeurosporenoate glycosyltransferase
MKQKGCMSDVGTLLRAAIALAGFGIFNLRLRNALRADPGEPWSPSRPLDVSLIVPARNEAENLPPLLSSIAALQPRPREVIVVDDHSTDDTAAIATSFGVRLVKPPRLPSGWIGKPWACAAGAEEASASLLLFTDADTVHSPDLLGRAAKTLDERQADLVSVLPWHSVVAAWERYQGIFHLLLLVAARAGSEPAQDERCFCIGQYLLIRRTAYERIGGHAAVRHRVAEDLAMAHLIEREGLRFALLHAPGGLRVRMYPTGLRAFVAGWRRNFREGIRAAGLTGTLEVALVLGWLFEVPRWLFQAYAAGDRPSLALATAASVVTCATIAHWQRQVGEFRARDALGYPVFALLFILISIFALIDHAFRRPVAWRGRSVRSDELGTR